MKSLSGIHWVTPVMMVLTLLAGCSLAVGHHLFYKNLAGTTAPTGRYQFAGANVSKQQFNTAVGTAFAFVVKGTLTAAVGMAYIQAFWRSAQRSKNGRKLSTLDTTFAVLNNAFGLTKLHVWVRYPLLLLLAIIAWSIPIASIITPATLSVQSVLVTPSQMVDVPKFDFTSYDFVSPMSVGGRSGTNYSEYCYRGPGRLVQRVATAVAAQGQVLPITPPAVNSSWKLDFWGPSLSCSDITGADRDDILASVYDYLADGTRCFQSYGYISWVPAVNNSLPFIAQNDTYVLQSNGLTFNGQAAIYVAALPGLFDNQVAFATHTLTGACMMWDSNRRVVNGTIDGVLSYSEASTDTYLGQTRLLRCEFLNASYVADFKFVNGAQTINVTRDISSESRSLVPADCVNGPTALATGGDFQAAIAYQLNTSCSTLNLVGETCIFNSSLVRTLSYQGIADAFGQLLQGTVGLGDADLSYPEVTFDSNIKKTVLLDTDELSFIQTWQKNSLFLDIASLSEISNGIEYLGLSNLENVTSRGPLAHVLEEAFQNITLSLLSEQYLQPNYSSSYAPSPQANVTFQSYHNMYSYDWHTLWTAYGVAIGFAVISVLIGLDAILLNKASYGNNFSTVLRISKASSMDTEIREGEGDGSDPLPQRLADARVLILKPESAAREDSPVLSVNSSASSRLLGPDTLIDVYEAKSRT